MISTGGLVAYSVLLNMAVLMWCLPRQFGVFGLFGSHVLSLLAWSLVFVASKAAGEITYDGGSTIIGIIFDTLLFNCVLLPASIVAAWRRHRELGAQQPQVLGDIST